MHLKKLNLKNYRCFEDITIDFEDQLTVLVAENGVGKTAILDAIAVAFGPFLRAFDAGVSKNFQHTDARLVSNAHFDGKNSFLLELLPRVSEMESQYPVSLIASGFIDGHDEQWSRELSGKKTQTTFGKARVLIDYAKKLQHQVRGGEPVSLPVLAHYGTGRLWNQTKRQPKKTSKSRDKFSKMYGYHDALNPNSNYKAFEEWFTDTSIAAYIHESKIRDELRRGAEEILGRKLNNAVEASYNPAAMLPFHAMELKHVQKAINQCLSIAGWNNLEYEPFRQELIVSNEKKDFIPAAQLSDGVKAMLSLTADIAYRCVQLNPHLASPPEETNGIVLIDEVDLHLHPKWQQTVLSDLQKAFPKIQFIVTTHSPQVLSTVHKQSIRLLGKNTEGLDVAVSPLGESYGQISSDVLESVMHVNPQPPVSEKNDLEHLTALVDQGQYKTPEAEKLFAGLKEKLGETHPQLQRLDRSIKRQERLKA